ncbi:hypothetical protein INT45_005899 [Circinella minor]|uniref:Uncharacterized protein n=1 Tax=Circinella minor TaxID=1195481 RepID=A0A8H7RFE1_9FUNG|nr:hypothetical protein INT45_005899 [Circinella minor]
MANLPTMDERIHTLGVKYLSRAFYLPEDVLLTELRPILRDNRHQWKQLQKYNEIWKLLPLPPEDASPRDLKSTNRTYRTTNLHKLQQGPNAGVLIKACHSKLGVDQIFFLPMTSQERSRLLCWWMGWLPGKPIQCTNCNSHRTSRHHLIECLDIAYQLDLPPDILPNPINHLLNKLPHKPPSNPQTILFLQQTWPKLMVALEQLDKVCHPDPNDDIPADPELGQQFVDWLTPPPPFLPSHDLSLDYILHL